MTGLSKEEGAIVEVLVPIIFLPDEEIPFYVYIRNPENRVELSWVNSVHSVKDSLSSNMYNM